jgi:hypothetical protein
MKILFINHKKCQCGVYEIGKRIFGLFNQDILPIVYEEVENQGEFHFVVRTHKPDVILYNYYSLTLPFIDSLVTKLLPKIKHIAIVHDQLRFPYLAEIENIFDAWIIHDETNPIVSSKKFKTIRPIPRYTRTKEIDFDNISIGTNGIISSQWKMYDTIVEYINATFDNITINMNLTLGNALGKADPKTAIAEADKCRAKVTKPGINLNITHDYLPTEMDVIEWLSKNTMNIYFFNPPILGVGVGGSPDLAIAAQSSLAVNDSYMLRHIHTKLGVCNKNNISQFIHNSEQVKSLYNEWTPERMTNDYKKMIETILGIKPQILNSLDLEEGVMTWPCPTECTFIEKENTITGVKYKLCVKCGNEVIIS